MSKIVGDITVVVPNYNHGAFLSCAIASIQKQNVQPRSILLIDDASTDNSWKTISQFVNDPKFSIIRNSVNMGVNWNVNLALNQAKTEYILFVAADDIIHPDLIKKSLELLSTNPAAALCSSFSSIIDIEGNEKSIMRSGVASLSPIYLSKEECKEKLFREGSWFMSNSAVFSVKKLLAIGGFDNRLGSYSDNLACQVLANKYGVCFIPECLAKWRRLSTGYAVSTALNINKSVIILGSVYEYMTAWGEEVFSSEYIKRAVDRYLFDLVGNIINEQKKVSAEELIELFDSQDKELSRLTLFFYDKRHPIFDSIVIYLLFLNLRHYDLFAFFSRRIKWMRLKKIE